MRNFYAKHMTALMQNKAQTPEPPIAVESSPQPPVQLRSNRRQRRFLTQDGRRLNGEINALATAGKPVTVRVGPDGKLHAVVDKKQLKQLEAQKTASLRVSPKSLRR